VDHAGGLRHLLFSAVGSQAALYSHKLSLIGFWSLGSLPFVGTHHYIYSPIPLDADHRNRGIDDADHSGVDGD